jgi:hypothetical protein
MNVVELNPYGHMTLARFFEAMVPLTFFTIWIIMAFHSRIILQDDRGDVWKKLLWPIMLVNTMIPRSTTKDDHDIPLGHR